VQPAADVPVTVYVLVEAGLTLIDVPDVPVLHAYVLAPDPVRVELLPAQILPGDAEAVTVGIGDTVTETEAVFEQPAEDVPVTVYVVVDVGVTESEVPDPPVLQLYVFAPEAVNVELFPMQIPEGDADALTVGSGFTVTVAVAVPVPPDGAVPVTVYVVVLDGLTDIDDVVALFDQTNVVPVILLVAFNVADSPTHIVGLLTVITGFGLLTVMLTSSI